MIEKFIGFSFKSFVSKIMHQSAIEYSLKFDSISLEIKGLCVNKLNKWVIFYNPIKLMFDQLIKVKFKQFNNTLVN